MQSVCLGLCVRMCSHPRPGSLRLLNPIDATGYQVSVVLAVRSSVCPPRPPTLLPPTPLNTDHAANTHTGLILGQVQGSLMSMEAAKGYWRYSHINDYFNLQFDPIKCRGPHRSMTLFTPASSPDFSVVSGREIIFSPLLLRNLLPSSSQMII